MASAYLRLLWLVRLGGTCAIMVGIHLALSSLVNLLYGIPLLGELLSGGVILVSAVVGLIISLLTIVVSLLVHHPLAVALPVVQVVAGSAALRLRSKRVKGNAGPALSRLMASPANDSDPVIEKAHGNLVAMAAADGKLDKREHKFLVRWGEHNGLSKQRVEQLCDRQVIGGEQLVASSREDLMVVACLALADGRISTKELALLRSMGAGLGMTRDDVQSMIREVGTAA